MKLTFVPFFFFLKNIYYILQKTTARNSFVSIYLFRVSRSISSILSSVFCFTIQSSTSLSSSRLPKLLQCCSMYYHPFHIRCVNRKKKRKVSSKKRKKKKRLIDFQILFISKIWNGCFGDFQMHKKTYPLTNHVQRSTPEISEENVHG